MESEIRTSGMDFVIVRPPILAEDLATGAVRVLPPDTKGHKITRGDLRNSLWISSPMTNIWDKP